MQQGHDLNLTSPSSPAGKLTPNNNNNNPSVTNNNTSSSSVPSWHAHVYAKPPRSPTPHRIADILGCMQDPRSPQAPRGVQGVQGGQGARPVLAPKPLRPPASVLIVPRVGPPVTGLQDADQPLNLTTRRASPTPSFREPLNGLPLGVPLGLPLGLPAGLPAGLLNGRLSDTLKQAGVPTVPAVPAVRVPAVPVRDSSTPIKRKRKDVPACSSTVSSTDGNASAESLSDGGAPDGGDRKRKKARTTFTGRQIFELEKQFEVKKYLSSSERAEMARLLGVTDTQVKIWFQNRRTKWKKHDNISNAEAAEHKSQLQQGAPGTPGTPGATGTTGTTGTPAAPGAKRPTVVMAVKKDCAGSPFSADEHSNGSLLTGSESGSSEESRVAAPQQPPAPGSPCSASLSPVASAAPARVGARSPTRPASPPPRTACTASPSAADTPTLGATLAADGATPVSRDSAPCSRSPSPAPPSPTLRRSTPPLTS